MRHRLNLGQGFCEASETPCHPNKEGHGLCLGADQKSSMEDLKQAIVTAPCLRPIDYHSDRCVILAVDSSCITTGFILLQLGADNKRYPSRFGSITWNERESRYSQAKIEIYGLWHALQAYRLYIIGVKNIRVENRCELHQGDAQQS